MDYELTVDIPTAGDTSVLITGIGEVQNGTTVAVSSEQAEQFKHLTGATLGRAKFQDGVSVVTARTAQKQQAEAKEPEAKDTAKGDA